MGGKWAKIKVCAGQCMLIAIFLAWLALCFRNPDMTQTRLLLTYWPHYLVGLAIIVIGTLLAGEVI